LGLAALMHLSGWQQTFALRFVPTVFFGTLLAATLAAIFFD
jgi:hypothetical protein